MGKAFQIVVVLYLSRGFVSLVSIKLQCMCQNETIVGFKYVLGQYLGLLSKDLVIVTRTFPV